MTFQCLDEGRLISVVDINSRHAGGKRTLGIGACDGSDGVLSRLQKSIGDVLANIPTCANNGDLLNVVLVTHGLGACVMLRHARPL